MAEEINLKINSNIDDAAKDVEKLADELSGAVDQTNDLNKATEEGQTGFKRMTGAVKSLGAGLKAIGVGLILAAFTQLKDIFGQNQRVVDGFRTATEFLSITFNKFFNFLSDNTQVASGIMSRLFGSEAVQNALEFSRTLGIEVMTRVKNLIQGIGGLGQAIFQVFKGDFKEASETAKTALGNLKDTVTGNAVETAQMDNAITKVTQKIKNFVTETGKAAKANVELDKSAELAESRNRILLEQFDAQAESLRQVRDDENLTFEQRIKANEDLGKLLEKQKEVMLANADIAVDAAQKELDKNKENVQLQIALNNAIADREGIIAQVTGFESEQLTNTISLKREQKDAEQELIDLAIERKEAELEAFSSLAGSLGELAGENKALAIAQATIDTYAGANKAFAQGGVAGFVTGAAIIAGGLANVRKILAVDVPGGTNPPPPDLTDTGTPAPQMVSGAFTLSGATPDFEPARAFVVSDDITNSQNKLANIRRRATI
jgi:hypothetical protein